MTASIWVRAAIAVGLLALPLPAVAAGDLLVAPTRVVLDGPRGTEVILNNVGSAPATYRISLELKRMNADGTLTEIDPATANPAESAALAMISYAPRRVTLPPNQPQAIRIGVRPAVDLPDGEYRAHLLFRAIPDTQPATAVPARDGLSIALTPVYGVTIPIIVRKGSLSASAAISNVHLAQVDGGPALSFTLARTGSRSVYGRIRVTRPGIAKPIYEARGIAVYAEIPSRRVALPIPADVALAIKGPVTVQYLEDADVGGGLIAEAQGVLN